MQPPSDTKPSVAPAPAPPATSPTSGQALGFHTLEEQTTIDALPLQGALPPWLSGSLLRTGPAKFEVGDRQMRHWFDGLAMLHRFTISRRRVSYGNRFLEGHSYKAARDQGKIVYGEFATDPCRSLFKRVQTLFAQRGAPESESFGDNANVNIGRLGERFVAMTETPLPVQFDPHTLEAAGVRPYEVPGQLSTAHPHHDRSTGGALNYAAQLGPRSSYRFFALTPNGEQGPVKPRVIGSLPVKEPAYMHSFGLTERWLVLAEFPFVVNPLSLALSRRPYIENYKWKPELGTRFTLLDRATGEAMSGFETDPCFAFHHINAFEDGGEVVVDLCMFADAGVVKDLYLDHLRAGKPIANATPTRVRLRTADRSVRHEPLTDVSLELPRINYMRCNERPYRWVWGVSDGPSGWLEQIVKLDTNDGSTVSWSQQGCFPGEPVFVPSPARAGEDDGVVLSVVLYAAANASFLLVLDAASLTELARASTPHHIPFGFHGQFTRDPSRDTAA